MRNFIGGIIMTEALTREKPVTIDEAAEFLNFKKSYLYKLICYGKIPCYRPGGKRVFFKQTDLENFVYRNRQSADFELKEQATQLLIGGKK
jgi:excisionase family DNA binding protein